MQVADDHTQAYTAIDEDLVEPVLFTDELADQSLPLPCNQAQATQLCWRNERATQQAGTCQGSQPVGIADVGLASWYVLDVTGVDDERTDVDCFQRRVRALPIDARAFHDHLIRLEGRGPRGQLAPVALETAKLALFDPGCFVRFFD